MSSIVTRRADRWLPPAAWSVRAAALLVALLGVVNLLSAAMPVVGLRLAPLADLLPMGARHGARLAAALAGFALLVVARNLWRRKRVAWLLSLVALGVSSVAHLVKGLDLGQLVLGLALALWLWRLRAQFRARSDPPSVRQGLRALAAASLFTLAYGSAGFYFLDRHFRVAFSPGAALLQTLTMFTQFSDPGLEPTTGLGRYFAASIYAIAAATFGTALLLLLRPVVVRQPATTAERARARAIVDARGRTPLARFALLPDKSYFFSPGGSVVAYAVRGRVAVALGDPIGPPGDAAAALRGFLEHCARNDWRPTFYETTADYLQLYRAAGFDAACIGYDALVDLADFSLSGRANHALRSTANRLTRLGYRVECYAPPLDDALLAELRAVSDAWLSLVRGGEKRFSMGWFDEEHVRSFAVMAVHAPRGEVCAFATLLTRYRRDEVSIDLMRRHCDAADGVMELLFIHLLQWAKRGGYATLNLGLTPLVGVGQHPHDPPLERLLRRLAEHGSAFYNFRGLHSFKRKFHPAWSPRYLVYPGPASLLGVSLALLAVHAERGPLRGLLETWLRARLSRAPRTRERSAVAV